MSTAVVGFLGIIAGGILSGTVQATIAWRDRRRSGRIAARLLSMHLWWAKEALSAVMESRVWNPRIDWDRFGTIWEQQNETLAGVMNTTDLAAFSAAFVGIEALALIKAHDAPQPSAQPPTSKYPASQDL